MNVVWTKKEEIFVKKNAGLLTDAQIADTITEMRGKRTSLACVRKYRQRLGIQKAAGRGVCKLKGEKE